MPKKIAILYICAILSLSFVGCNNEEKMESKEPQVQQEKVQDKYKDKEYNENKEIDKAYELLKPVIDNNFYYQRHNIIKSEDGETLILQLHMDEYVAENINIEQWNEYIYQYLNFAKVSKKLLVNNDLKTNFAISIMEFEEEVVYIYILNNEVNYNIRNE
ncbi:MAG: hypothetical protein IJH34_10015 [Romboutsia sp.]|nr:hypothetical protein [Romboutsia sp.]